MRNHALLYVLRPNGEPGELDWIGESNSALPLLWRILFADACALPRADVERLFEGTVAHWLASDAQAAVQRYARVIRWLERQPRIAALADVVRYLTAARRHLDHCIACCRFEHEPAPLFCLALDEFVPPDPLQAREQSTRWWREFDIAEQGTDGDEGALYRLFAHQDARRDLDAWRTWSESFGFALFTEPYFADSFRQPLPLEYEPREQAPAELLERWPAANGFAVVLEHDRYGYVDSRGCNLLAPQFDTADDFTAAGVARVGRQRRYGLLRADGSFAVPLECDALEWREELGGWLARRNGSCTLLHEDGSSWTREPWDALDVLLPHRLLRARRGRNVGALHWSGEQALPCLYASLTARLQAPSQLLARVGARMGVIDETGRVLVPFTFSAVEELEPCVESQAHAHPAHLLRVYSQPENARPKVGVWDIRAGRMRVACDYDAIWIISFGHAQEGFLVATKLIEERGRTTARFRLGVLDAHGRLLVPMEYAWLGVKADLGKTGAFDRVREALHSCWSRGQPVQAAHLDSGERVWIGADGLRVGAGARPVAVANLRAPVRTLASMSELIAAAFYKFVSLPDYRQLREPLLARCAALGVKGTILLAEEGINGTIAGESAAVRAVLAYLRADARLTDLVHKESPAQHVPFYRMKVRLKREIVTMGVPHVNPARNAGTYVKPEDWNALIEDPEVVVIDARNDYEVALGTFERALNPRTRSFRELPQWLRDQQSLANKPKVAMFCTGGIRCEKSTAFLRSEGFEHVYHLQGGILKYLETVPEEQSRWRGECFVFDERVAIGHGLELGAHELCRSCREPIGAAEKDSELYVPGVSCPKCHHLRSEKKKHGLMERQRQVELARARGDSHIGVRQELRKKSKRQNTVD